MGHRYYNVIEQLAQIRSGWEPIRSVIWPKRGGADASITNTGAAPSIPQSVTPEAATAACVEDDESKAHLVQSEIQRLSNDHL
jgi:hypothetical protein